MGCSNRVLNESTENWQRRGSEDNKKIEVLTSVRAGVYDKPPSTI